MRADDLEIGFRLGDWVFEPRLARISGNGRSHALAFHHVRILQLLADGMSNADVAQQLVISQETVKSHVRHILTKLEAETRTQAVAIAMRESMID